MLINYTTKELDLLARIMRAEALAEGNLGMLMVGNVVVNRAIAKCLSLFEGSATTKEKDLAKRVLRGEYFYPATHALWFYAPKTGDSCKNKWYDQALAGRYKNHCFYNPDSGVCVELY